MQDMRCDVKVGTHYEPYWRDKNSGRKVCDRHRKQFDEVQEDYPPFDWEEVTEEKRPSIGDVATNNGVFPA